MRRVVITGRGVGAPNGVGKGAFWSACQEGVSGVGPIRSFDASTYPVQIAGEVPDFDVAPYLPDAQKKSQKVMSRATRFAVGAAGLAVRDAGFSPDWADPTRVGVVMGTGVVPIDLPEIAPTVAGACGEDGQLQVGRMSERGTRAIQPMWILKYLPNMVAAHISLSYNAQGPNSTVTTACVAGTQAIGEAFRLVARGDADVMLAGGADSRIDPLMLLAYSALGALSRSERPA